MIYYKVFNTESGIKNVSITDIPNLKNYRFIVFELNFGGATLGCTSFTGNCVGLNNVIIVPSVNGNLGLWSLQVYYSSTMGQKINLTTNADTDYINTALSKGWIRFYVYAK